jgi:hypothetical protein
MHGRRLAGFTPAYNDPSETAVLCSSSRLWPREPEGEVRSGRGSVACEVAAVLAGDGEAESVARFGLASYRDTSFKR